MHETKDQRQRRRMLELRRQLNAVATERRYHTMNNFEAPEGDDLAEILEAVPEEHHALVRIAVADAGDIDKTTMEREAALSRAVGAVGQIAEPAAAEQEDPRELVESIPRMYDGGV